MSIRSKLAIILGVALCLNLLAGLYILSEHRRADNRSASIRELSHQIVATSLSAQVHFKKQVQEWKNVLIRGHEAALHDQYWSQFVDEETRTRQQIRELLKLLEDNRSAWTIANDFLQSHMALGKEYREALQAFPNLEPPPQINIDRQVRGIDRRPTDLLDEVVETAQRHNSEQLDRIIYERQRTETWGLLAFLGVSLLSVLTVFALTERTVVRRILTATAVANRISHGDLSSPIAQGGRDEAAQLMSALGNMQTSLAQSQETLRRSEARTRLLLESTGEGVYGVDNEGCCIFVNPAGLAILGYENADSLRGRRIHDDIHHSRPDGTPLPESECRALRSYRDGQSVYVDDEVFWRPDGSAVPVEYRSHPVYEDGALYGAVVTFSDISERKRTERALRDAHDALSQERTQLAARVEERTAELNTANLELAKAARAKDDFLAFMSHELRTPLTTIMGLRELLADQLYGPLNADQIRALHTIGESSHHLLELINEILDVTKVEAGKVQLMWDDVPVEHLLEGSLRLVSQQARKKMHTLAVKADPQVKLLRGDGRRLKQVLVNLLSNAVKFTPQNGHIDLELTGCEADKEVRITVTDNGIGIPREALPNLFKPFERVGDDSTRAEGGTGLGLVLVYRLVQLHGGRVEVESEPGSGSRFTVVLPWAGADASTAQVSEDASDEATHAQLPHGRVVLLVEDNPANQILLKEFLEKHGLTVLTAGDGKTAVEIALEQVPDLIVMDVRLPEMNGLQATETIREDSRLDRTPIIALTALAMPGDRERCLKAGMDDYMSKPVGLKELLRAIAHFLGERS